MIWKNTLILPCASQLLPLGTYTGDSGVVSKLGNPQKTWFPWGFPFKATTNGGGPEPEAKQWPGLPRLPAAWYDRILILAGSQGKT